MSTYVIYARKSTESEDRQVLSIDSQIQELQELAMRRGTRVAEVLSESHSAKAPGRPVFGALMRRISKGEIQGIICWKMDRLARNHLDTGVILQALADGRLREVITSDRTYTRDGNDRFMGTFELGMATKFIDDLRANVRRGNRARLARGWVTHTPALGYLIEPATKTVIKDPDRFDLVRRMWELLLTGSYRPMQILKTANEKWGLRTRRFKRIGGNPVPRTMLYKMFGDPFYMGIIRLRSGETFPGAHPPMVTREEFARAQELLGRPGRERPQRHAFAYTGLIHCGNCNAMVTAEEHVKPSGRRFVYYRCSRNKKGIVCREPPIPEPLLEQQITTRLRLLTMPESILGWICRRVETTFNADQERRREALATLQGSLQAIARETENLLSLRLKDLVDDDTFRARKQHLEERRQQSQAQLQASGRSQEEVTNLVIDTFRFGTKASGTFLKGTTVQKRMIMEATGLNYELRGRKLLYELKNPFRLIAEAGSHSNWCTCADAVRTWLQDTTEYFALPSLDGEKNDDIMPYGLYSSKVG